MSYEDVLAGRREGGTHERAALLWWLENVVKKEIHFASGFEPFLLMLKHRILAGEHMELFHKTRPA